MEVKANIKIELKKGILDPAGKVTTRSLKNLGFSSVKDVRIGKFLTVTLDDSKNVEQQKEDLEKMCNTLLANPLIENYSIEVQ